MASPREFKRTSALGNPFSTSRTRARRGTRALADFTARTATAFATQLNKITRDRLVQAGRANREIPNNVGKFGITRDRARRLALNYKPAALTLASEQIGAGVGTIDILSKAHAK
jgi:hypothetical protein